MTMPVGMASGKFHGDDHDADAAWLVRVAVALAGSLRDGCAGDRASGFAAVVLAEVDRFAHVGVGLGDRLAGLEDLERGELGAATRAAMRGRVEQDRGAFFPWRCRATRARRRCATSTASSALADRRSHCGRRRGRVAPGSTETISRSVATTARPSTSDGSDEAGRVARVARRPARSGARPGRRSSAMGLVAEGRRACRVRRRSTGTGAGRRRRDRRLHRRRAGDHLRASGPSAKR